MVFTNDITIVLSGGSTNIDPTQSLGGDPSSTIIVDNVLNNLFDDVEPTESEEGAIDYRCIYFFNDGDATMYNCSVFILNDLTVGGGSIIEMGILESNEIQRIALTNSSPTGGSFTLSYSGEPFVSNYNIDLGVWASNLQATLLALVDTGSGDLFFKDVIVSASQIDVTTILFDVIFQEQDGKRDHPSFVVVANNLSPTTVNINISTIQPGSPINTIAPSITSETTPPSGVGFFSPTEETPIIIPKLIPSDGFPLWFRRTTIEGTAPVDSDGVQIRFIGNSFDV